MSPSNVTRRDFLKITAASGLGAFVLSATDAWVSRSVDGGQTWTSGAAGLAAVEVGFPPPSPFLTRNYFHAEYDQFGTLWMCYLRSDPDFLVGQDDIVMVGSLDNGASWIQAAVIASTAPFAPFGAGLLSSAAEMDRVAAGDVPFEEFVCEKVIEHAKSVWEFNSVLFVADSVQAYHDEVKRFFDAMPDSES